MNGGAVQSQAMLIFCSLLGLIIGSFLNVIIYRLPKGRSIVRPRSHCPDCGHELRFWELAPVLSYILLRGRCAQCRQSISLRYPAVELLTALLFALTVLLRPERSLTGLGMDLCFIALLIALSFIDWEVFRLPDSLVLLVVLTGMANIALTGQPDWWDGLAGALGAGGVFALLAYFYPKGMGWGDVKLVAALGLYLGLQGIFAAIFLASVLGILAGTARMIILHKGFREPIPFGPFLAVGALMMLWTQPCLDRIFL